MKQVILSAAIFLMTLSSNSSSAQSNPDASLVIAGMSAINAYAASHTAAKATEVNIRAMRDFNRSYKNAPDAKWFKSDKGYFVSFDVNGTNTKIVYDNKGRRSYVINSYAVSKLNRKVRSLVLSNYFESTIIGVHQFELDNATVYVVKMLNQDSSPLTLKIIDNTIEDITSYGKK